MNLEAVFERLRASRFVPVVEIEEVRRAVPLALALASAGLPLMEVTMRTPAALEAIAEISAALPDFLVGAGTVLSRSQLDGAVSAGAHFGVSPGFHTEISAAASMSGLPFIPGATTATEILAASAAGHRYLKFFPAETSGGAPAIAALAAPFAELGIRFMPTGGIRPGNAQTYLDIPAVFAIGGTWIAPRAMINDAEFAAIEDTARAAVAMTR
jgi:2-dehydro-3-deoxyphosphogluconate aldolase/(4S)-4-hydroxy-2-oxoglutarate aldolase